jgi:sensor histidine kinase regulating citrate/malate metabolism
VVKGYGGTLTFESVENDHTDFIVALPKRAR